MCLMSQQAVPMHEPCTEVPLWVATCWTCGAESQTEHCKQLKHGQWKLPACTTKLGSSDGALPVMCSSKLLDPGSSQASMYLAVQSSPGGRDDTIETMPGKSTA